MRPYSIALTRKLLGLLFDEDIPCASVAAPSTAVAGPGPSTAGPGPNALTLDEQTTVQYLQKHLNHATTFPPKFFALLMALFECISIDHHVHVNGYNNFSQHQKMNAVAFELFKAFLPAQPTAWLQQLTNIGWDCHVNMLLAQNSYLCSINYEIITLDETYRQTTMPVLLCLRISSIRHVSHQFIQQIAENLRAQQFVHH